MTLSPVGVATPFFYSVPRYCLTACLSIQLRLRSCRSAIWSSSLRSSSSMSKQAFTFMMFISNLLLLYCLLFMILTNYILSYTILLGDNRKLYIRV